MLPLSFRFAAILIFTGAATASQVYGQTPAQQGPDITTQTTFSDNYSMESTRRRTEFASNIVKQARICIGEKVCPVGADLMFPCGWSEVAAARSFCTIYQP